jgi:hypothetical protein
MKWLTMHFASMASHGFRKRTCKKNWRMGAYVTEIAGSSKTAANNITPGLLRKYLPWHVPGF